MDENCLSYWYPKIKDLPGIKTPRTAIIKCDCVDALMSAMDGPKHDTPAAGARRQVLFDAIHAEAEKIGYPVFLRTGHTSGKHDWNRTCFLPSREAIPQHVLSIVDYSGCVDIIGLPCDIWVVRELLPTKPAFHAFDGMPICREFRCFGRDGACECAHPYWPEAAIFRPRPRSVRDKPLPNIGWQAALAEMSTLTFIEETGLRAATAQVTKALGGYWSVDWLQTASGEWYLTDMAKGEQSFHWPGCAKGTREHGGPEPANVVLLRKPGASHG